MFAWWYVLFICLGLAIVSTVCFIICKKYFDKYYAIYSISGYSRQFNQEQHDKADKITDILDPCCDISLTVLAITWFASLILIFVCVFCPMEHKKEVKYFKEQKVYVEMAIENGDLYENFEITQTVIKENSWLAKAKASLNTYGKWSAYYGSGLEKLEPIAIERNK